MGVVWYLTGRTRNHRQRRWGNSYTETFRAELSKISGQTVTAGAVNAHAQVVIRVQ